MCVIGFQALEQYPPNCNFQHLMFADANCGRWFGWLSKVLVTSIFMCLYAHLVHPLPDSSAVGGGSSGGHNPPSSGNRLALKETICVETQWEVRICYEK